jgi:hypothetical protein
VTKKEISPARKDSRVSHPPTYQRYPSCYISAVSEQKLCPTIPYKLIHKYTKVKLPWHSADGSEQNGIWHNNMARLSIFCSFTNSRFLTGIKSIKFDSITLVKFTPINCPYLYTVWYLLIWQHCFIWQCYND